MTAIAALLDKVCVQALADGKEAYHAATRARDAVLEAVLDGRETVTVDLPGHVVDELTILGLSCEPGGVKVLAHEDQGENKGPELAATLAASRHVLREAPPQQPAPDHPAEYAAMGDDELRQLALSHRARGEFPPARLSGELGRRARAAHSQAVLEALATMERRDPMLVSRPAFALAWQRGVDIVILRAELRGSPEPQRLEADVFATVKNVLQGMPRARLETLVGASLRRGEPRHLSRPFDAQPAGLSPRSGAATAPDVMRRMLVEAAREVLAAGSGA